MDRGQFQTDDGYWIITPLNDSLARIDWYYNNKLYALQAIGIQKPLQVVAPNSSMGQLWRLQRFPGVSNNFLLESLLFPGYCATFTNASVFLQPIGFLPTQQWWFNRPAFNLQPVFRNTTQQYVPNSPLPPATVTLVNPTQNRLVALVAELQNPQAGQEVEIPAGGSVAVELQRDQARPLWKHSRLLQLAVCGIDRSEPIKFHRPTL